ncbi:microtubule organization protein AKNA [Pogoniulus pusillus]|uniref:microtubule organization protein AKNA n=1 Tax=Pogoniulus pusillus TaxID=488313 RepID=UPI0030B92353
MASPAPWLRWTQTQLRRCKGEQQEEEEDDDDFEKRMDEDGVIGLGEDAGSPPWGDGEGQEVESPAEEGRWHPRRESAEEERGSSRGDESLWGAESDGEPYPEISYEGQWGSGSSGSPEALRRGRTLCQPSACSTDGADTSGLSDTSPGPSTPSRRHRGWGTVEDTSGGHEQGWTPRRSLLLPFSTDDPHDTTSIEPIPKPQPAGKELPAPGTVALAPTGKPWSDGTPSAPQLHDRSQVPKKTTPTAPHPKPCRPLRSLSPRRRHPGGREAREPSGAGSGTADGTQYGRGRLNHPLPDLSKVEARVKFDQSYRPPRGRVLPACPRAPGGPIGFKSPAEIVREVLLSSGEGAPPQPPASPGVPLELRSPRQATALVQQLQDDYHKLLTKYAEAENTIDQLRLGARVSLYADLPQPSRSLAVGTMGKGCQVMALSIPQARTAAFSTAPATASPASPSGAPAPGPSGQEESPQSPSSPPPRGCCPTCQGPCCCSGSQLTQTLAGQTQKLQAQVESFQGWIQAGSPASREQLQRLRMLKAAQDALEQAYLGARQQHPETSGGFDPDRSVEGDIFRLGLHLEELKERLEPGARRQLPPQHPAQPHSPPAHSPLPTSSSLHPESPTQTEGPRGTAGDSKAVTEWLPRPLWNKQQRLEEDFGDLLQQCKHFRSLPESLSLEQLSLTESGSQEEVDGPAAGDGGPSEGGPRRTWSLEEGADLETFPSHPPERRAVPPPLGVTPWPGRTQSHLLTAEEPPAAAKPPLRVPTPPQAPTSRRSSGGGSAVTQHRSGKEQRIVSPETDSGFVGSEASRVSPPVHTPEHQPPASGTPGSLGPSVPIPATLHPHRKREVPPLPSETTPTGIYPAGGQGSTGGAHLPRSTPWQSSSPRHWAESAGSELGHDGDSTHTDSEAEGRSCVSTRGHPPATTRGPASPPPSPRTPSPTLLSPQPPSLDASHCDLLGSRLQRDQAIRALRDEVRRLQRRLEESLRRSHSYPDGKATTLPATLPRRQPRDNGRSSPNDTRPSGEPSPMAQGRVPPGVAPTRRMRSASVPRDGPELELSKLDSAGMGTEGTAGTRCSLHTLSPHAERCWGCCGTTETMQVLLAPWAPAALSPDPADPTGSHPASLSSATTSKLDPSCAGPRTTPSPRKAPPGPVSFRGQYTGGCQWVGARSWWWPSPRWAPRPGATPAPREELGASGCPRCHGSWPLSGDASRQPQHSTPRRTHCPTCRAPIGTPAPGSRDRATHADAGPSGRSSPGSHPEPRAEKLEQPRLWYLAASPAAAAAISCLVPVPLVPYVPSMIYCSPAAPTSAPAAPGVPLQRAAGHRQAQHPPWQHSAAHHRFSLDPQELEDLNWSLSRAVEAAQSMRVTTTRMSRVLATELGRVRDLRGSCLF